MRGALKALIRVCAGNDGDVCGYMVMPPFFFLQFFHFFNPFVFSGGDYERFFFLNEFLHSLKKHSSIRNAATL